MTAEQTESRYWSGGCQCGAVRFKVEAAARRGERLLLPHVPEGDRRRFGLFVKVAYDKISLDAWRAEALRLVERRKARLL